MEFINYLMSEWSVISQAPTIFIIGACLVAAVIYSLCRRQFSDRIGLLKDHISFKDGIIAEYKRNTGAQSPDEARRIIAELEKRLDAIDPRTLRPKQIEILERELSQTTGKVTLVRDIISPETDNIAAQLVRAFKKCNWLIETHLTAGTGLPSATGVEITVPRDVELSGDLALVVHAFKQAGIRFDLSESDQQQQHAEVPSGTDVEIRIMQATDM